ncbi:MAG: hypothetical protein MJ066_03490 [Clostridia bacterium]|nr:hypothetical protein [Clostridia bacterium]
MANKGLIFNLQKACGDLLKGKNQNINFDEGDFQKKLKEICLNFAPMGKVAVVYTEKLFSSFGEKYTSLIKSFGSRPFNIVLKNKDFNSEKNLKTLLAINEDTRIVITFENELFNICSVLATLREIKLVHFLSDIPVDALIEREVKIENKTYQIKADINIILNTSKIIENGKVYNAYEYCFKFLPAFIDYRLRIALKQVKADKVAYHYATECVSSAFTVYNKSLKEQALFLLEKSLILQIANISTGGELFEKSSICQAQKFVKAKNMEGVALKLASNITKIYSLCFSGKYNDILEIPDYNGEVDIIKELIDIKEIDLLEGFKKQLKVLRTQKEEITKFVSSVKKETASQSEIYKVILNTYTALNGKIPKEDYLDAIKYSGDLPNAFNAMSVVRESGILEYL